MSPVQSVTDVRVRSGGGRSRDLLSSVKSNSSFLRCRHKAGEYKTDFGVSGIGNFELQILESFDQYPSRQPRGSWPLRERYGVLITDLAFNTMNEWPCVRDSPKVEVALFCPCHGSR